MAANYWFNSRTVNRIDIHFCNTCHLCKYLSIAVLAALDCLIGGWYALMRGEFDNAILISGFFVNTLLAAGLALLGDFLGLDLYLAAVVAFGLRIFSNIGYIRRYIIQGFRKTHGQNSGRKSTLKNALSTFSGKKQ